MFKLCVKLDWVDRLEIPDMGNFIIANFVITSTPNLFLGAADFPSLLGSC